MEIFRSGDEIPIENFQENHPAIERLTSAVTNHGFSQMVFFLKADFTNVPTDQTYFMELQFPLLNHIEFLVRGNAASKIVTGNRERFSSRPFFDRKFRFRIPGGTSTTLLKIRSESNMILAAEVLGENAVARQTITEYLLFGIYVGIITVMVLYNLFILISTRDFAYLYYILYSISILFMQLSLTGITFQFIYPSAPEINAHIIPLAIGLSSLLGSLFVYSFLIVRDESRRIRGLMYFLFGFSLFVMIGSMVLKYRLSVQLAALEAIILSTSVLAVSALLLKRGKRQARFFVLAWAFLLVGLLANALKAFGVLPSNLLTEYAHLIGACIEVVLLSFALADKINIMKAEREEEQVRTLRAETRLKNAFERFVPKQFLFFLQKKDIAEIQLGDSTEREMTILFSDIRSFTSLSEKMTPQENFNFLNGLLKRIGPLIRQNDGFIDKYIGDAVMALFPETVDHAVDAAIQMRRLLVTYNATREKKGYVPIDIGIGIHSGNLMLGTIGEEERMEGTVISDAVNLASRLEGLTKVYQCPILTTQQAQTRLKNPQKYNIRTIDHVKVKGKADAVTVVEVIDGERDELFEKKLQTKPDFEQALRSYAARDLSLAGDLFRKVLDANPADKAAYLFAERISQLNLTGIPDEWDGVHAWGA